MTIFRNVVAGALIAATPLSSSLATTRPSSAVPAAGGASVTAVQDQFDDAGSGVAWPAIAVIVAALAVAIWIIVDDDEDGEGSLSRG